MMIPAYFRWINRPFTRVAWGGLLVTLLAAPAHTAPPGEPEALAPTLRALAQEVLAECREKGYQDVGVLKFLVVKGPENQSPTPAEMTRTVGAMNSLLGRRLELALVIEGDNDSPIGIVDDASAVAHTLGDSSFLSARGRRKLLAATYPLHWGEKRVQPDLLVSALVRVDPSLKFATISLLSFSQEEPDLDPLGEDRQIAIDASLLSEMGESFSLSRGAFTGGKVKTSKKAAAKSDEFPDDLPDDVDPAAIDKASIEAALDTREDSAAHPLNDPQAAVQVRLLYNGKPVKTKATSGEHQIPEPQAGQRVEIELTKDDTPHRYAVCVKVNGENTYGRTRLPDANCRKWLLTKPGQKLVVRGYQMDDSRLEAFQVLSDTASKDREFDYGKDIGRISVTVFAEASAAAPSRPPSFDEKVESVIAAAKLPTQKASSYQQLKHQLLGYANRGLIVQGETQQHRIEVRKFNATRSPVMSLNLNYYKP